MTDKFTAQKLMGEMLGGGKKKKKSGKKKYSKKGGTPKPGQKRERSASASPMSNLETMLKNFSISAKPRSKKAKMDIEPSRRSVRVQRPVSRLTMAGPPAARRKTAKKPATASDGKKKRTKAQRQASAKKGGFKQEKICMI